MIAAMNLTTVQWVGLVLLVVGLVWWFAPGIIGRLQTAAQAVQATLPQTTPPTAQQTTSATDLPGVFLADTPADLSERMARLAQLQTDLEQRGHSAESETAGTWYALMRDPVISSTESGPSPPPQQEAAQP